MRKVIVFMMTSLDGYIARPNGDIDWHVVDEEFNTFAEEQIHSVDTIMFGRATYEGMMSWWPTQMAIEADPVIANLMNTMPKIVFSTTLSSADWHNTRLIKDHIAEVVAQLKQQPGKDLIIFGSNKLSASFINLGLLDELRIMVAPVLLGEGLSLFEGVADTAHLKLLKTRVFQSGNVLHYYAPVDKTG
ncbi:MAG: dihydrofolate reductase family protein [Chloroflexota bacterium]